MSGSRPVEIRKTGLAAVAELARRRSDGWSALTPLFQTPTRDWVGQLRDGTVRQRWEDAVGWRSGELAGYGPPLISLGAFERSSRRRDLDHDLATLTTTFDRITNDCGDLEDAAVACDLLYRLCADEAVAWSAGNLPRARGLRVHQHEELGAEAGIALREGCATILAAAPRQPYLALAQVGKQWVDGECRGSGFVAG